MALADVIDLSSNSIDHDDNQINAHIDSPYDINLNNIEMALQTLNDDDRRSVILNQQQSTQQHQQGQFINHKLLSNETNPYIYQEHVCGSIDIRNSVAQFKKLENCTVVEGYLRIVLIENGQSKDFENLTFPKLREVTDYFLLFRVNGLESLITLFPNLSVIRGRVLIHNYAFVIYQMFSLQEIGLKSLTNIVRGDVLIQKNPNLCFVDTIDWSRITRNFLISGNKDQNLCLNCPKECPQVSAKLKNGKSIGDSDKRVCWTPKICQKYVCSAECRLMNRTCSLTGECCPEQCSGGCDSDPLNPSNQICFACKNYVYQNRCYKLCPNDSYVYYNRRCLTKDECHKLSSLSSKYKFKAFMNECDYRCPVGYAENTEDPTKCTKCGDNCPKVCESSIITNIADIQSLKGCTLINGSLEINIYQSSSSNNHETTIVKELEENLKNLVEIKGFLKIVRSFPLITLNFLKNLRIIGGHTLERNSSLLIIHNPNLQDLWTFREDEYFINNEKRIKILNGHLFVHMNPKLCYQKIKNLSEYTEINNFKLPWDERDVSTHSNGDMVLCDVSKLFVTIRALESEVVWIEFENFKPKMKDTRSLLGYLIYYREAEHQNVTIFDGRDACSHNEWTVIEYDSKDDDDNYNNKNNTELLKHIIPKLKPYTQYALYIKTYTINTATKGAQSDIIYFTTKPSTPTQPLNLFARAETHNKISVKWDPPAKPNGIVTHYIVRATRDELRIVNRNYCDESTKDVKSQDIQKEPIINEHWLQNSTDLISKNKNQAKFDPNCCSCDYKNKNKDDIKKFRPNDVEQSINFEDYLLNIVYIKRTSMNPPISNDESTSRRRRSINIDNSTTIKNVVLFNNDDDFNSTITTTSTISSLSSSTITISSTTSSITITTTDIPQTTTSKSVEKWQFKKSVKNESQIVINDLYHFTEYTIEVKACQNASRYCSVAAMTSIKTLPLSDADDIDETSITYFFDNSTKNSKYKNVHIKWKEPYNPNGFILFYEIKYERITQEQFEQDKSKLVPCIPRYKYERNDFGYTLFDLTSGNYSVRLRARSSAQYGNWTKSFYIYIEDQTNVHFIYWIIIVIVLFISILILIAFFYKFQMDKKELDLSVNPDYYQISQYFDPKWEVSKNQIRLINLIGEGSFGQVHVGEWVKGKSKDRFAVKLLKENASNSDRINFLKEAQVMKAFTDCHHVVKLLGICTREQPFFVMMEIMSNGDLRNFLRSHRNENGRHLTFDQLYKMAIQIADGMAYLASKKFVHRDLAARNCMLSEDLTVKIGDFGMTRDINDSDYYRKGDKGLLPVRWMSPESLKDGLFTTYSDVWAYGVVLWEMATLGSQPYQGKSNEEVLDFVIKGNILKRPENCSEILWHLMVLCWKKRIPDRPTFIKIIKILLDFIDQKSFLAVSFYNSSRCEEDNNTILIQQNDITEQQTNNNQLDEESQPLNEHHSDSSEYNSMASDTNSDDDDDNDDDEKLKSEPLLDNKKQQPNQQPKLFSFGTIFQNKNNINMGDQFGINTTTTNTNDNNRNYPMEILLNNHLIPTNNIEQQQQNGQKKNSGSEESVVSDAPTAATTKVNYNLNNDAKKRNLINGHYDTSMV